MPMKSNRQYRDMMLQIRAKEEEKKDEDEEEQVVEQEETTTEEVPQEEPTTGEEEKEAPIEEEKDGSYIVEGYACKYSPYLLYEDSNGDKIYEEFQRGCFDECDCSDVIMQYNHEGRVYARQSNGTLDIDFDDEGLHIRADLSKTQNARNLYEDIATGMVTKMSWGFMPSEYHYDKSTNTIVHTKVKKIFDVSAVSIPANDNTEINARSFSMELIESVEKEIQEQERQKAIIRLKLKLED